jgi:hypothetical protein
VSQRSDFESLVQAREESGVKHEARTGHKAVQHMKIRRYVTKMMLGTGRELLKHPSRRVAESCFIGTIIVNIMKLQNLRSSIRLLLVVE